jgi:hypothetical protein
LFSIIVVVVVVVIFVVVVGSWKLGNSGKDGRGWLLEGMCGNAGKGRFDVIRTDSESPRDEDDNDIDGAARGPVNRSEWRFCAGRPGHKSIFIFRVGGRGGRRENSRNTAPYYIILHFYITPRPIVSYLYCIVLYYIVLYRIVSPHLVGGAGRRERKPCVGGVAGERRCSERVTISTPGTKLIFGSDDVRPAAAGRRT